MQPGFLSAVSKVWGKWGTLGVSVVSQAPGSGEGEQILFLWLLPLLVVEPSCFLLPFYKRKSYLAWAQHTLWLNSQHNLTVLDGPPQPCHNLSTGPHSENFLPGVFCSPSFRVAWPQVLLPHSIHLGVSRKGKNTTCHPNLFTLPLRTGDLRLLIIPQVPC